MENVDARAEISRLKAARKAIAAKLASTAEVAMEHFENGSFEVVEAALMECAEGVCDVKNRIQERRARRIRKDSAGQASPV